MANGVHPKDKNGNYCVPSRVSEEILRAEWENREYKAPPSVQDGLDTLKRIEEQKKRQESMAKQPVESSDHSKTILQSSLFTRDKSLMNDIALGRGKELLKGGRSFEVLKIQQALKEVNLYQGVANGCFDNQTESAVKKFQQRYDPTHKIHAYYALNGANGVVDKNTVLALDEAVKEGLKYLDDAMDEKWLTVPKGQFTFDNEGDDIESSHYFSRKAHVPNNNGAVIGQSGVTIGRGLDIGNPPTGATGQSPSRLNLKALFQESGLAPELSDWLLSVEGIKKESALQSLNNSVLDDDELTLTRKQQHLMFNVVYEYMEEKTRILLTKPDVQAKFGVVDWDNLPRNVKDVLVDLTYRGDNSPRTRKGFVPTLVGFNGGEHFKDIMSSESPLWEGVNSERRQSRWGHVRF